MSNEMKPVIVPEQIHLLRVNLIKGNLESEEGFLANPKSVDGLEINIAHQFRFDFDEKRILIRLIINIVGLDSDKKPLGISASYALDFFFVVDNLNDFISDNKAVADILGATLLSISISTARGILLERTHGTFFEGFMLPIVDPFKLIREQTPHPDSAKKSSSK
jgi:hypothetical protein